MPVKRDPEVVSIYSLLDPRDNAIRYVGATSTSLSRRLNRHIDAARNRARRKSKNKAPEELSRWILSLLSENLRPIALPLEVLPKEAAPQAEVRWIAEKRRLGCSLLNITIGGPGHNGAPRDDATKRKLRDANIGRTHSDLAKAKMSLARSGVPKSAAHREAIAAANKGKGPRLTPEQRAEIAAASSAYHKGRAKSPEHRAKLAEHLRRLAEQRKLVKA